MLEVIVVLVVLGIAIGLVVSRQPRGGGTVEVRSAATRVMQGLRATRAEAIAYGQPVLFRVDPAARAWRVGAEPVQALPRAVQIGATLAGKPVRGVMFAPDGSSTGGVILVASPTRRLSITVDWLTGRIRTADVTAAP